jgi:hypothetical protein
VTDSTKLNDWFQVAASVGVIISLVFVGLQIQQSREIAIADIYQQRAAMSIQVQQGNYTVERYERAVMKLLDGETLTPREEGLLRFAQNPWFSYWENVHFQYQIGLLSEEQWISTRNSMLDRFKRPIYQEWWEGQRQEWRASFADEVDRVLVEAKASE